MYIKTISTNGGIFYHQEEKMMARLRDQKDTIEAKPEGDLIPQTGVASSSLSIGTSRRWSGFKNPRIVRVSRTFGGKDRHSKVCTIRGLRDRRIRLSVPTAIQLYDLQERLGLNQPSKVIDWLLDVTKLDIDELPPLHFPQFHDQHSLVGQSSNNYTPPNHFTPYLGADLSLMNNQSSSLMLSRKEGININDNLNDDDNKDEDQYQGNFLPSMMNNYGNFYNYDPSSLSLSQFGNQGFLPHSEDSNHQLNSSSSTQQLFFCSPSLPTTTASLFPHNDTSAAMSSAFYPSGSGLKSIASHELHSAGVSNTNQQIHKGENGTQL